MKNFIRDALPQVAPDVTLLRQHINTTCRGKRPALRVALEALIHEQAVNPSPELDADIAEMLIDMGGDRTSLESMVNMEGKTSDVLYGIWRGIWGGYYASKDRKKKAKGEETWPEAQARKKREEADRKRLANKNFKPEEIIDILKKTFANASWVKDQKLVEGDVSAESIALHIRNVTSWAGSDIVGSFSKSLDGLKKLRAVLLSDGVKYGQAVEAVEKQLNELIIKHSKLDQYKNYEPNTPEDAAAIETAVKKATESLKKVKAPSVYFKPFVGVQLPGGTTGEITNWHSGIDEPDKPSGEMPTKLPALTADQVVKLAQMAVEQFTIIKEIENVRRQIENVIYHDDGSPINDMYDHIDSIAALYDVCCDQTPNDVHLEPLIEACMMTCKAAFAYMDRSVVETK